MSEDKKELSVKEGKETCQVKVTADTHAILKRYADAKDETIASALREAVLETIAKEILESDNKCETLDLVQHHLNRIKYLLVGSIKGFQDKIDIADKRAEDLAQRYRETLVEMAQIKKSAEQEISKIQLSAEGALEEARRIRTETDELLVDAQAKVRIAEASQAQAAEAMEMANAAMKAAQANEQRLEEQNQSLYTELNEIKRLYSDAKSAEQEYKAREAEVRLELVRKEEEIKTIKAEHEHRLAEERMKAEIAVQAAKLDERSRVIETLNSRSNEKEHVSTGPANNTAKGRGSAAKNK